MTDTILFVRPAEDKPPARNSKQGRHNRAQKPPKKITQTYLYNSGLAYLQRFPSSVANFKRVMGQKIKKSCNYHKDQDPQTCNTHLETVIARFEELGLLDDCAYLRGMVRSLRARGLSAQAITFKLSQKGLPTSEIKTFLISEEDSQDPKQADIKAAIIFCRRKRIGPFSKTPWESLDQKGKMKSLSALARGGHGSDIAQKVSRLTPDQAQELLA